MSNMAGRHKWAELKRRTIPSDRLAAVEREASKEAARLTLRQLRELLGKTQVEVAVATGSTQSWLSILEREGADVHLSTLRSYIAALGGELELRVHMKEFGERLILTLPTKEPIAGELTSPVTRSPVRRSPKSRVGGVGRP